MKIGQFKAEIARAHKVLRELGIGDEHNTSVSYKSDLPALVRKRSYLEEWRYYGEHRLFDLRLAEGSLFQFKPPVLGGKDYSFCYYEVPIQSMTYKAFVYQFFGDDIVEEEIDDAFYGEYQEFLATAALREAVTPIRFDFSPKLYMPGVHPAAHLHIASRNEIRIATERMLMPMSFVLFVLRQIYPDQWRLLLEREDAAILCRAVRDELEAVDAMFDGPKDKLELILR